MNIPTLSHTTLARWEFVYHPQISFLNLMNRSWWRFFVRMSANWSRVETFRTWIVLSVTYCLKWWYLALIWLVLGLIVETFASSTAPESSSNSLHCTIGIVSMGRFNLSLSSFTSLISGIVWRKAWLSDIYLLSVTDWAISGWSWDAQIIRHPAYITTYPVCDFAVVGSSMAMDLSPNPL
jgi:hypothetical protein